MTKPPFNSRLRAHRLRRARTIRLLFVAGTLASGLLCKNIYNATVEASTVYAYEAQATSTPVVIAPVQIATTTPPHELAASVSAYSASVDETDSTPNITANGDTVHIGGIACPRTLPFGTVVEVLGKKYKCNDRMSVRYEKSPHFDIFMGSKASAFRFGRQNLIVKVYN